MGEILTNHNGIKLDPQLKDVGYLTSSGKKAVGVIGEVMLVDHLGTEVDMADIEVDITTVTGNTYIGKPSTATGRDFTTAYLAGTTITLSGYPAGVTGFIGEDIEFVRQINSSGVVVATYSRDDTAMAIAANVLTITGATFGATDTFIVCTNVPRVLSLSAEIGGDTFYSNAAGDFTATINNGTKTITITGLPFTLESINVVAGSIRKIAVTTTVVTNIPLTNVSVAAGIITLTDTINFVTGDVVLVILVGPAKAYDIALDLQKTQEQSPINEQYVEESIVDTTNVATGTYYPASTGMPFGAYKNLSITGKLIDGAAETTTLTVEAINDEDTASGDWVTIYGYDSKNNTIVNSMSATNTTTTFAWDFDVFNYRNLRFLITATAATNTVIIKIRRGY